MTRLTVVLWLRQLVFGLSLSCLLLFSGCITDSSTTGNTLTVATEPTFPPFEFQSTNGDLQGFDIDLMNAIASSTPGANAQSAGLKVKYQNMPFAGMIPALQAQTVDAAVAAMTITAERAKTISFSRPYFKSGLAIVTRTDNQSITNFDNLKNKTIGVQIGTTGAQKAKSIPGSEIRTFNDSPLTLQALINGNVDAVLNDRVVILYGIKSGNLNGLKVVSSLLTEEFYGIPTPKGSPNLQAINQGLETVLKNGIYAKIYQKWFGIQPPQLPEKSLIENQAAEKGASQLFTSLSIIFKSLPTLLSGALVTLELTAISVLLGMIGGTLIGIVRLFPTPPLPWIARAYIDFFRGTPLLVQIFMIYFGLPAFAQNFGFTFTLNRLAAAVIALSLNSAAYIAEVVRAGIQSIEPGQAEASQSLGLSSVQTMRYVIFPQALRRMLPPLGNEFISLLKDTSLVAIIGFEELFRKGQLIVADNYRSFEIYTTVALVYLFLTLFSSQVFSRFERSLNPIKEKSK
ncbi:MAG: ABC transporter permease subunit [Nostoc sp.]|uniref:ABC transporter permease subunit n=1 Tax=Nostoc sp. TaxID=1180 RepID=UPI002FFB5399